MKKKTDILKKLKLALLIVSACFCCAIMFLNNAFAQQSPTSATTYKNAKDYYEKEAKNVEIDKKVHDILTRLANIDKPWYKDVGDAIKDATKFIIHKIGAKVGADVSGVVGVDKEAIYYMEQLRNLARGEAVYNDASSVKQNLAQATVLGNYRQYASVVGEDSAAEDIREKLSISLKYALEYNKNLPENQRLTEEEVQLIENEATRLLQIGAEHAKKAAQADGKDLNDNITEATADALNPENTVSDEFCPPTKILRAKYQSGCWSCLVVEKLTSAFLTAAKQAYGLSQRAGITLLWIGVVMWLLMWALKNVSSLAQVDPGNILNELIKFMFKVGLAYWFIVGGLPMVRNYFITPLMGVGSSIAQQFWHKDVIDYTDNFIWEDEIVTEAQEKEITENIAKNNKEKLAESAQKKDGDPALNEDVLIEPEAIQYDSTEAIVQDIQKAFISILQKQLTEIKNSCNGPCDSGCRFSSCTNAGHREYVAKIHAAAGSGFPGNVAYCQAAITAAMNQLNDQIGGNVADILKKVGAGCALGLTNASKYKNGFSASSQNGGNVTLCVNGQMAKELKLNVGDTIYYHKVTTAKGLDKKMGATSGYHAVTYTGGGGTISFNGDGQGSMCNSFYYNVQGRVACLSCMIREKLKNNPTLAQGINNKKLSELAAGYNVTLINYSGGVYSGANNIGDSSLIIPIEDVKYSGPTDIMPKSVMNSILGVTKAITDITAENMILGDAIMCYSTLKRGGAWTLMEGWWTEVYITNAFMWIEGFIIFCFGMLLTLAIVYYLMDMSFKIGFAVLAMPIVVGLWPFNMTKGKFSMCVSIIAKSAATFAFLAMTTTYTVALTEAVINWGDTPEAVAAGEGGIAKLYTIMDEAGNIENISKDGNKENMEYAATKLSLFSTTFMLLLFAFLYSFKLVQNTVPDLVDKFFPDKTFGGQDPMHKWATAASKWVKDQAMKPVGYARDIAMNQAGNAIKGLPKNAVGFAKNIAGKGDGDSKTLAGRGMRGAGNVAKGTGKVAQAAGKGVQGIGKGLSAAGKGLQAIPVVGNVIGGAMMAAGKATEVAGKGVEMAGKGVEKAGDAVKKAGNATDKAYNEFGTRNKKDNKDE